MVLGQWGIAKLALLVKEGKKSREQFLGFGLGGKVSYKKVWGDRVWVWRNGKGLLPAISKLFHAAKHRYCVRHMHENMNLTWKGSEYKEMLWNCATACTIVDFNRHMDTLKGFNKKAYEWLRKIAPKH
ncbi:hypothetical protein Tco_0097882 [Tanacetum coccineum]